MSTVNLQVPPGQSVTRATVEKALAPLLVVCAPLLVLICDRSLLFNQPGYLDSWMYYSLYRNLSALKILFADTYYPSRLSLILPGYLVNQLFEPLTANYVMHLLVWLAATVGLYLVIQQIAGRRSALVAATVFGFCPYVVRAVGWDHPDGIGNAYYLLTMAFLTLAGRNATFSRRYLFLAGITCAGALYCNLTWAFLLPSFGPYWLFLRRARGYSPSLGWTLLYSAAGFLWLSLVFGVINYQLAGVFLFYLPSINYAIAGVQVPSPYGAKDLKWIFTSPWLYPTMAALLTGVVSLVHFRWRQGDFHARMVVALYANLLFCVAVLIAWEVAGQPLLQIPYYASYLLAPIFLFLGVAVFPVVERLRTETFCLLLAAVFVTSSWVWWDPGGSTWLWMVRTSWTPLVVVAITAVVAAAAFPKRVWAVALAVVGLSLLSLNARASTATLWTGRSPEVVEDAFLRIVEAIEIGADAARPAQLLMFWYNNADKNGAEFSSINSSYMYGYTKVPSDYPKLPDAPGEGLIAILSSLPERERKDTLGNVQASLKGVGFEVDVVTDRVIDRGGVRYAMTIVRQRRAPIPADGTYIRNGDFESDVAPWGGGLATARLVDDGQSGKGLELVPQQGSAQYVMQWNFGRLQRGRKYNLVVWTKSGTAGDEPFVVGVWDSTAARFVGAKHGTTTSEWQRQEVTFTNDSDNLLSVELMKNSPSTGTMLFDSVTLAAVESASFGDTVHAAVGVLGDRFGVSVTQSSAVSIQVSRRTARLLSRSVEELCIINNSFACS